MPFRPTRSATDIQECIFRLFDAHKIANQIKENKPRIANTSSFLVACYPCLIYQEQRYVTSLSRGEPDRAPIPSGRAHALPRNPIIKMWLN